MSDNVVLVENLSKRYLLTHRPDQGGGFHRYRRFSDVLVNAVRAPFRRERKPDTPDAAREEFWALKDISFAIKRGEVIGVIGRNGAGKSTLLKILSRITEPTGGRVEIDGRVASLLEVGTGFHPELTGRENIYLDGAILGMTRGEIKKKFDEIVAFAEVEKFLDTTVKHYSSGMYVRLAFAVAAHLEPEILIVDEVLAVGDMQFQQKCLGKMQDVSAREGRTVLFVSHNLTAIQMLCGKAIYLKSGRLAGIGPVENQVTAYLQDAHLNDTVEKEGLVKLGPVLELTRFKFNPNPAVSGQPVEFTLELRADARIRLNEMAILIYSNLGARVAVLDLRPHGVVNLPVDSSPLTIRATIRSLPLVEGDYQMGLYIGSDSISEDFLDLARFRLSAAAAGNHVPYPAMYRGLVELDFSLIITAGKEL
jgi:lipopolysaccharide transport system ATP-binding protein